MSSAKWFRRSTWTPEDQAEFRARLKRSRSAFHKAQYLRIQAVHLQEVGTEELFRAALGLLDEMITQWPQSSELSMAHAQRAECFAALGKHDAAIEEYRLSFAAQRRYPNSRNNAYLDFGELITGISRTELYPEVLSVLNEFGGFELFPVGQYRSAVIRALIADHSGQTTEAQRYAQLALQAAAKTESPFRYHRKLGLVGSPNPELLARLKAMSSGPPAGG